MSNKLLISILFCILFCGSCKKICLQKKTKFYISESFKDYFGCYLQVGYEWKYLNSEGEQAQSLIIQTVKHNKMKKDKCSKFENITIFPQKSPSFLPHVAYFALEAFDESENGYSCCFYSNNEFIFIPFSDSKCNFINCKNIDTLTVNGITYSSVIHYSVHLGNGYEYYFAKNKGLIKAETPVDTFYLN